MKGAKEVGLSEGSRPKFKRNPHKFKAKRKDKVAVKEKTGAEGALGVESKVVKIGSKRKKTESYERPKKQIRGVSERKS